MLVFPETFDHFEDYLDMAAIMAQLLIVQNYERIYRLVSFHPDHHFETNDEEESVHYIKRTPYRTLHINCEQRIRHPCMQFAERLSVIAHIRWSTARGR